MIPRKVEVVPYREEWKSLYNDEKKRLISILLPDEVFVHHIGSTSIPGLSAKPIIDIIAEAADLEIFDKKTPELNSAGYIAKGENGIKGRRYFFKCSENGERLFHLHAFEKGSPQVKRHLAFRDYLVVSPEDAARYASIKETAARKFPYEIEFYIDYKDAIVKEIESKALEWWNKRAK
ncbi:GrpB family protein [Neobacillus sp. PS3-34]|uniref:GrpB family protein n=1 Tax=Neobacillus sp. PS3-34 TaxID=3070678 RepID=UPI0027E11C14|nr:GrpB family protein [Neobacillus sp. PS3-34]WML47632.1 GrpB family protein [Neobacillus sp. PS3-34]